MSDDHAPNRVRELRKELGRTLKDLAEVTGLHLTQIQKIELGTRPAKDFEFRCLGIALETLPADLFQSGDGGLTATERELIERYRLAPHDLKTAVGAVLNAPKTSDVGESVGVTSPERENSPYNSDVSNFAVTFLRFVISWNDLEDVARKIISGWTEGILVQGILANLNAMSLQDALKNLAGQLRDGLYTLPEQRKLGELIAHFELGMDRLRVRRNFYIHAIRGIGKDPADHSRFYAQFYAIEGRGKISFNETKVTSSELMKYVRANWDFGHFGRNILKASKRPGIDALLGKSPKLSIEDIFAPELPEMLDKNKHYLGQARSR